MDGWVKKGEVLKCAACNALVEDLTAAAPSADKSAEIKAESNALSALLGETLAKTENPLESVEKRFCRDCKHRVMNAFRIYCSLHDKDVSPMDDCPDYIRRQTEE